MLKLSSISLVTPYSPEWFTARLGMLTGSKISCICGERGIGDGGMTYIRNKVYEKLTGNSTEKEILTEGVVWGIKQEPIALKEYQEKYQIPSMVTDKHIVFDSLYSVTPDALIFMNEKFSLSKDESEINCEVLESKSYMTASQHMEHVECQAPSDIFKINKPLYWQVLSQMTWANVNRGNACFFHPDFPRTSKYRTGRVVFSRMDHPQVREDIKILLKRMEIARGIYNEKLAYSKIA